MDVDVMLGREREGRGADGWGEVGCLASGGFASTGGSGWG